MRDTGQASRIKVPIVTESNTPGGAFTLLDRLTDIASQAAAAILAVADPEKTAREKPDHSPVTEADHAAERIILEGLADLAPDLSVVSEESGQSPGGPLGERFFLVDPLDGTREFLAGESEFTVNIALIENGAPVLGVIAAPAMGQVWRGIAGCGAQRLHLVPGKPMAQALDNVPIQVRTAPPQGARAAVSRFHRDAATERLMERFPGLQPVVVGSSIKFCRLAEGAIDLYARQSPMAEWDIAAGHAIVTAAGGTMTAVDGAPLRYGNPDFRVKGFIARGTV